MEVTPILDCSGSFYNREDESNLEFLGLVKHPQVMSCIYITLFLVTMLIIAQQVMTIFTCFHSPWFPSLSALTSLCLCLIERGLLPSGLPA